MSRQLEVIREMITKDSASQFPRAINMEISSLATYITELRNCVTQLKTIAQGLGANLDLKQIEWILERTK